MFHEQSVWFLIFINKNENILLQVQGLKVNTTGEHAKSGKYIFSLDNVNLTKQHGSKPKYTFLIFRLKVKGQQRP